MRGALLRAGSWIEPSAPGEEPVEPPWDSADFVPDFEGIIDLDAFVEEGHPIFTALADNPSDGDATRALHCPSATGWMEVDSCVSGAPGEVDDEGG